MHQSRIGLVEHLTLRPELRPPSGHSQRFQIIFPYSGLFGIKVGQKRTLLDANRTLFMGPGQDFSESRPLPNIGYAATALTPAPEFIEEIAAQAEDGLDSAVEEMSRPATMKSHVLTRQLILAGEAGRIDPLKADELIIATLQEALAPQARQYSASAPKVVERTKEVLHAQGSEPLSLIEIARHVGVSPVYLTQTFTRSEGMPLYRYHLRLRLTRALEHLPDCEDITGLALDLGFSSHSHFGASFKSAFNMTPSAFRRLLRG